LGLRRRILTLYLYRILLEEMYRPLAGRGWDEFDSDLVLLLVEGDCEVQRLENAGYQLQKLGLNNVYIACMNRTGS
jgi:hypothetical protein